MDHFILRLYITGHSPRSRHAISNLRRICEQELRGQYEMEIIDILDRPQRAEEEKILATPTVVKERPAPARRIIGDLSDFDKVMLGLDLRPRGADVELDAPGPPGAIMDAMGEPRPGSEGI